MIKQQENIADRNWCDAQSDQALAQYIAGLSPKEVDVAIRTLNQLYRAGAGLNHQLDPVNMIPRNPVGELLDTSYSAISGRRAPLTAPEIEPVVAWIRAHQHPA